MSNEAKFAACLPDGSMMRPSRSEEVYTFPTPDDALVALRKAYPDQFDERWHAVQLSGPPEPKRLDTVERFCKKHGIPLPEDHPRHGLPITEWGFYPTKNGEAYAKTA